MIDLRLLRDTTIKVQAMLGLVQVTIDHHLEAGTLPERDRACCELTLRSASANLDIVIQQLHSLAPSIEPPALPDLSVPFELRRQHFT